MLLSVRGLLELGDSKVQLIGLDDSFNFLRDCGRRLPVRNSSQVYAVAIILIGRFASEERTIHGKLSKGGPGPPSRTSIEMN